MKQLSSQPCPKFEVSQPVRELLVGRPRPMWQAAYAYDDEKARVHGMAVLAWDMELEAALQVMWAGKLQDAAAACSPDAETISLQEVWEAAGGNQGVHATKDDVIRALKQLDLVCDEAEKLRTQVDNLTKDRAKLIQEVWEAAGGSPDCRASKGDLLRLVKQYVVVRNTALKRHGF